MGRKIRPEQLDLASFDSKYLYGHSFMYGALNTFAVSEEVQLDPVEEVWEERNDSIIVPHRELESGQVITIIWPLTASTLDMRNVYMPDRGLAGCCCAMIFTFPPLAETGFNNYDIIPPIDNGGENYVQFVSNTPDIHTAGEFLTQAGGGTFLMRLFPMAGRWFFTLHVLGSLQIP